LNEIKAYLVQKRNLKQMTWQHNKMIPQVNTGIKPALNIPTIPSHRPKSNATDVLPVQHNTKVVDKNAFPPNLEKRMRDLGWIV
ncbi:MAG: hypothetical protein JWQ09_2302, partial [Segetibacter sp.]|nr:hypothetical protein [Segetibacter sp.]